MQGKEFPDIKPDRTWSLFLDRDGVINRRIPNGYITSWDEMEILPGVMMALNSLSAIFGRIFIVTNQQGIGKGLMTESQMHELHAQLMQFLADRGVHIDRIYHCPHLAGHHCECRKPATGMAMMAREHYPDVDFKRSIMVGDMPSDMLFGLHTGMHTVFIGPDKPEGVKIDRHFPDLWSWTEFIVKPSANSTP